MKHLLASSKFRFAIVGLVNTALDFGILFILNSFGVKIFWANMLSTTCAFIFSFLANKHYTFQSNNTNVRREFILFVAVTLFGLWVLQAVIIRVALHLFADSSAHNGLHLLLAKLIATLASLTWNYVLYSRVVFAKNQTNTPNKGSANV
jgi:putative flippase GtrA